MRILVVEHQTSDLDQIVGHLSRTQHEVVSAKNNTDGIAAARRERPHLILCALSAPSNGIEVYLTLRTDIQFDGTPIVAVTHFSSPEDRAHLLALGFAGVIAKPLAADFVGHVERFLPQ